MSADWSAFGANLGMRGIKYRYPCDCSTASVVLRPRYLITIEIGTEYFHENSKLIDSRVPRPTCNQAMKTLVWLKTLIVILRFKRLWSTGLLCGRQGRRV